MGLKRLEGNGRQKEDLPQREVKGHSDETCCGYRDFYIPLPDLTNIPNNRFNLERIAIAFK